MGRYLVPYAMDPQGLELFRPYRRLLFVSDGTNYPLPAGRDRPQPTVADMVGHAYPDKRIVRTDFLTRAEAVDAALKPANVTFKRVDNGRFPLPFRDSSRDFIGMGRGLCLCEVDAYPKALPSKDRSCGGIVMAEDTATRFVGEVARILDTSKPGSLALLHGLQDVRLAPFWGKVTRRVMSEHPVEIKVLMVKLDTPIDTPAHTYEDVMIGLQLRPR